jgi:hypothetical protein
MDASYEIGEGIVLVLVAADAAAALVSAALAWRGPSSRAPYLAGSVAIACALVLLASSPLAFARSVCAYSTPAVPYVPSSVPPSVAGPARRPWSGCR